MPEDKPERRKDPSDIWGGRRADKGVFKEKPKGIERRIGPGLSSGPLKHAGPTGISTSRRVPKYTETPHFYMPNPPKTSATRRRLPK